MAEGGEEDYMLNFDEWRSKAKGRPLRILVGGITGAGKSTLINNLFGEHLCEVGDSANAVTTCVEKKSQQVRGFTVEIYDTPGLECADERSDASIVGEISATVEVKSSGDLDLFFYCKSIGLGAQRIKEEDIRIMRLLTAAFGNKLWERGIIVLTFANKMKRCTAKEYQSRIEEYRKQLRNILISKIKVDESIADKIPVHPAGDEETIIPNEVSENPSDSNIDTVPDINGPNWQDRLLAVAVMRTNSESVPALVELAFKDSVKNVIKHGTAGGAAGAGAGAIGGAVVGGVVGATVGSILPVAGTIIGGELGAGIGAGIGAAGGLLLGGSSGGGIATGVSIKCTEGIKLQFQVWRERNKYRKILANKQ